MKKIFLIIVIFLLSQPVGVFALEPKPLEDLNLDTKVVREDNNYITPSKILIVPLEAPKFGTNLPSDQWLRGIYFYTVEVLGFSDIPFHYIVTKTGDVYKGNSGGDERAVKIEGVPGEPIVIAYLSDRLSNTYDPRSTNALNELASQIANANAISKVEVSGVKFVKNPDSLSVQMQKADVFGNWVSSTDEIQAYVNARYNPTAKQYSAEVLSVTLTSDEVEPGAEVEGTIKIKNTGEFGMYGETSSEILLSKKDNLTSQFFLNKVWRSDKQIGIFEATDGLFKNEEKDFSFKVKAPLIIGTVSESFELITADGVKVQSNDINLTLKIKNTDKKIAEILSSELGYVRVRAEANSFGAEVA